MEKKSLDDILRCSRSGRALSPARTLKQAESFMQLPLNRLRNVSEEDGESMKELLTELLDISSPARSYAELTEDYYERCHNRDNQLLNAFFALALLGYGPCHKGFFNIPVQDYLEAAGREDLFNKWFSNDVAIWERDQKGKAPTIHNVLVRCVEIFGKDELHEDDNEMVRILGLKEELLANKPQEQVENAFKRDGNGDDLMGWANLAATWVWILMIECPRSLLQLL